MEQVLILPDIHGRTFWKSAVQQFPKDIYPSFKIVFLGDYLDPYVDYDGISKEEAFVNFEEILDYANNDDRVIMLIGNHDWHYFVDLDRCRMDRARERDIEHMFVDSLNKFRLTYTININNTKYVFSHAGITQKWLDDISGMAIYECNKWNAGDPTSDDYIAPEDDDRYIWINALQDINKTYDFELFEKSLQNYDDSFYSAPISMVSRERGGWCAHGSLIWADVYEHLYSDDIKGTYQIFGHTISYPNCDPKAYAISPEKHDWAMLDASHAFILDSEGNISEIPN